MSKIIPAIDGMAEVKKVLRFGYELAVNAKTAKQIDDAAVMTSAALRALGVEDHLIEGETIFHTRELVKRQCLFTLAAMNDKKAIELLEQSK